MRTNGKDSLMRSRLTKKGAGWILLALLVLAMAFTAFASGLTEVDTSRNCSLTLRMVYKDDKNVSHNLTNGAVTAYLVSDFIKQSDGSYAFDVSKGQFAGAKTTNNETLGIITDKDLDTNNRTITAALEAALSGKKGANEPARVSNGSVAITGLKPGLYLIVQTTMSTDPNVEADDIGFNPFLMTLPDVNGRYDSVGNPKPGISGSISGDKPPKETEPETEPKGGKETETDKPKETEPETPEGGGETESETETEPETKQPPKET